MLGADFDENKYQPTAQAAGQTLPDATPPVGKIHPFRCPSRFKISDKMSI